MVNDPQFMRFSDGGLYFVPSSLELVIDCGDWQASDFGYLTTSITVEKVQDEIACAFRGLFSPNGIVADPTKVVLPLQQISRLLRCDREVKRIEVSDADEPLRFPRRSCKARQVDVTKARI